MSKIQFIRQQRRLPKQAGVTMIEYALIAALIAIAAVVTLGLVGTDINIAFQKVLNAI